MDLIDLARRQFLKNAGTVIGSGLLLCYCPTILAFDKTLEKSKQLNLFYQLSTALTAKSDLSFALAQDFFEQLMLKPDNAAFQILLKKLATLPHQTNIKELIKQELQANTEISNLIRKIISMWYLGAVNGKTISVQAFKQGLVWELFGSTVPGICAGRNWYSKPALKV